MTSRGGMSVGMAGDRRVTLDGQAGRAGDPVERRRDRGRTDVQTGHDVTRDLRHVRRRQRVLRDHGEARTEREQRDDAAVESVGRKSPPPIRVVLARARVQACRGRVGGGWEPKRSRMIEPQFTGQFAKSTGIPRP